MIARADQVAFSFVLEFKNKKKKRYFSTVNDEDTTTKTNNTRAITIITGTKNKEKTNPRRYQTMP